ncbi:MAG TPA: arginine--tRNA ligase [Saprospiraceae bacterium]|nr:arginine--tRNA ligase [Saprospiraceae bacterium]HMX85417.1 arginine--tRNA ligase [Saprospiraceae bacterium]HMZ72896.1 arginine--tRNA ligase [Saprospiraceae bacterium]HNE64996.1 arginine--tRNA ligase [Saprospiraceae bacterium]HNG12085.1 arginine--tRNA ligase [Saprospiraceae bacterium]
MNLLHKIQSNTLSILKSMYADKAFVESDIQISPNKTQNKGDYTVLIFPLAKKAGKNPTELGNEIQSGLKNLFPELGFEAIGGFLNIVMNDQFWKDSLEALLATDFQKMFPENDKTVLVEYASPNTNKPLHLGHIRNILLGWSIYRLLQRLGYNVVKTQVVNDRGIAICKSMLAWQKYGEGRTPASEHVKGDHFVGEYYVLFESKFQEEYKQFQLTEEGKDCFDQRKKQEQSEKEFFTEYKNQYFNNQSTLGREARAMLLKWEEGDPAVRSLWSMMNGWVLEGFEQTYTNLGVDFDKVYFESETYMLGKQIFLENIDNGIFYKKTDGSVWINLENQGLYHKLVLRSDGTSVYITQDTGMADIRYEEYQYDSCIYVVADEQDYHFKVLFEICKALKAPYADGLHHLSYGMVELPSGRMKSREGTVVDADDLIAEVINEATKNASERNELIDLPQEEQNEINRKVGMAALKYHIIKVNPKKKMIFDPKESVDLQGHTGPYIQNAFVRISSVLRKLESEVTTDFIAYNPINEDEKELLMQLSAYKGVISNAAESYDPSVLANYTYSLAKSFHKFYHNHSILKAESPDAKSFRLSLSKVVATILADAMHILGIEMPEKM